MASIRNRSPWRVSIKAAPNLDRTFASKKQAEAHQAHPEANGIAGARVSQDRTGAWEVRVRRQGAPDLVKTFPNKKMADDWASACEGDIVKGTFIDTSAADKWTVGSSSIALLSNAPKRGLPATPSAVV